MTQETGTSATKLETGKLPAAKTTLKPVSKKLTAVSATENAGKQEAVAGAKIKVTQIGSKIARRSDQEATLIGLGLNKLRRSRVLEDTPAVRGMIYKVKHLVVTEAAS